jgi:hypothetical protein
LVKGLGVGLVLGLQINIIQPELHLDPIFLKEVLLGMRECVPKYWVQVFLGTNSSEVDLLLTCLHCVHSVMALENILSDRSSVCSDRPKACPRSKALKVTRTCMNKENSQIQQKKRNHMFNEFFVSRLHG